MGALILLGLTSCALNAQESGLLRHSQDTLHLDNVHGETWELRLKGDAEWLEHLEGHSVRVSGSRWGDRIHVKEWMVLAGADGSAPYLGLLERHGANLVLNDRNSGARFVFDPTSFEAIESGVGKVVLVRGFVVGPHVLHVVDWEILGAEVP